MRRAVSLTERGNRAALMMAAALASYLLFGAIATAGTCAPAPEEIVTVGFSTQSSGLLKDDFEDGALDRHWSLKHILARSHAYTQATAKQGRQALLLTVHHGDEEAEGAEADRCSERAELMEPG